MNDRMTWVEWALLAAIVAIVALTAWATLWPSPANADTIAPASVEGGACVALYPDRALTLGAAIGIRVAEVGGRLVFIDGLKAAGYTALGVAISTQPVAQDNGLRLGVSAWREEADTRWCLYLRQAVVSW